MPSGLVGLSLPGPTMHLQGQYVRAMSHQGEIACLILSPRVMISERVSVLRLVFQVLHDDYINSAT